MEKYAAQHDVPIVGPACARVLYQLARLIHAPRVFAVGSAMGYSALLSRLRTGGLFVTDNVLLSGHVARPATRGDGRTRAVQEFNRLIYRSPRLFTTILPLRDGLAVSLKVH
jgi:predicted O-methyltransferase YrrM